MFNLCNLVDCAELYSENITSLFRKPGELETLKIPPIERKPDPISSMLSNAFFGS